MKILLLAVVYIIYASIWKMYASDNKDDYGVVDIVQWGAGAVIIMIVAYNVLSRYY